MILSASSGRAQPKKSSTISMGSGQPSSSLWSRKKTGHSCSSICYSEGERMAAWMSLSQGSPCTQTSISTSSPIIRPTLVVSMQDTLQKEVHHPARILKQNSYPANFIYNAFAPPPQETADMSSCDEEPEKEREPMVVIPYVAEIGKDNRCVCRMFNFRVVFKSRRTLHSMLTTVKDMLPLGKQSNVVYCIPCSCRQVHIGETRLKEHQDACERGSQL